MPLTVTPFTPVVQPVAIVSNLANLPGVDVAYTNSGTGDRTINIPAPPQKLTIKSLHISFDAEPPDGVIWQIKQGTTVLLQGTIVEQSQAIALNFSATSALTAIVTDSGILAYLNVITEVL